MLLDPQNKQGTPPAWNNVPACRQRLKCLRNGTVQGTALLLSGKNPRTRPSFMWAIESGDGSPRECLNTRSSSHVSHVACSPGCKSGNLDHLALLVQPLGCAFCPLCFPRLSGSRSPWDILECDFDKGLIWPAWLALQSQPRNHFPNSTCCLPSPDVDSLKTQNLSLQSHWCKIRESLGVWTLILRAGLHQRTWVQKFQSLTLCASWGLHASEKRRPINSLDWRRSP